MFSSQNSQVSNGATYIEDVFSTYLYTGTGASLTITNNIDLSTKGGLVWLKSRSSGTGYHNLFDTNRGTNNTIQTNVTDAQKSQSTLLTNFNTNGFTLGQDAVGYQTNQSGASMVSWTFRKQPKFFDVVAGLTADSNGNLPAFNHSLASVPACVFLKATNSGSNWVVYHRGLSGSGANQYLYLNSTNAASNSTGAFVATSTTFQVASGSLLVPDVTYVAYLFAHDAGGFGLTGTDNVISCGSFTTSGFTATVNLGYEAQWVLVKRTDDVSNWRIYDTMRGWINSGDFYGNLLLANTSGAETNNASGEPNSTGFRFEAGDASVASYIYIAIRRGPMKVPTSGTSVFAPVARSGTGSSTALTSPNIVTDMTWIKQRDGYDNPIDATRLTGSKRILFQNSTSAEVTDAQSVTAFDSMTGYTVGTGSRVNASGSTYANWVFQRAPSVFDVICYTGDGGSNRSLSHNLQVVPELVIYKRRSGIADWLVWTTSQTGKGALLNTTDAFFTNANTAGTSTWTSSTIYIKNAGFDSTSTNGSGSTYVAYLFATCAGVSKVGSYTGTGTLTTINCGFTSGARFVMIKRTDSTGPWYIWDTARGIVAGTDPSLMINDSEIEVNANSIYTASTGFQLLASPSVDINTSGGTYIYLAMA